MTRTAPTPSTTDASALTGGGRAERDPEAGIALVLVLWMLVVLSLQVAAMQASVRDGVRLGETAIALIRGEALMQATLEHSVAQVLATEKRDRWLPDGTEHVLRFTDADVAVTMIDESGRVNVNLADQTLLEGMILAVARSQRDARSLAQRIVAARTGEEPGRRQADTPQEQRLTGPGPARAVLPKQPFLDPADLVRLEGFDEDLLERLSPYLTTATGSGSINPMVASEAVLRALPGVTPDVVARVLRLQRLGGDQSETIASLLAAARPYLALPAPQSLEEPDEDRQSQSQQQAQRPADGRSSEDQQQGPQTQPQLARGTALRVRLEVRAEPHIAIGGAETVIVIGLNSAAPYITVAWHNRVARP